MPKKKVKKKSKNKQSKHRKPSSSANNSTSERVSSGDELPISAGESSGVNEQAIDSVEVDENLNLKQNDDEASVDENLNLKQNDDEASVDENLNPKKNDNNDSNVEIEGPEKKPSTILADVEEIFEDQEEPKEEKEKKSFTFLQRLLTNVGADVLRRYFRNIHPNWTDDVNSLTSFDEGALMLKQHEKQLFQTGDTKKWDVSLLINVLRFTKISSQRLAAHPDHDTALKTIRQVRNEIISHGPVARLEDSVFDTNWILLKDSLILLGATEDEVDSAKYDYSKLVAEQHLLELKDDVYRQRFVAEEKDRHSGTDINKGFKPIPETSHSVACTTWQDFIEFVNNFNAQQSHFVLLVDKMSKKELENIEVLSSIPWKIVLDFNPDSEDNGFHKMYTNRDSFQLLTSSWTPGTIKRLKSSDLEKEINKLRTQWLFVNGRTDDVEDCKPKKTFSEWERFSKREISRFFSCCSDMFDKHMSIICILLWLRQESLPFVDVTLRRLEESFNAFKISFCCINKACCQDLPFHDKIVEFPLTSNQIKQGVESFSNRSSDKQSYLMPTSQAGVSAQLTQRNYVYLSEHLQLFYDGCEKETLEMENEEQRKSVEEQHRRSFLSGNLISPVSLHFHHDAERDIERDIFAYVQKILSQPPSRSTLISIRHSPGTGGSTIARRVLWNLRKSFPCVVVKFPTLSDYDESDKTFIKKVCERISVLEEECGIPVLVLVDSTGDVGGVGNRIMRNLSTMGKKSLVLECLHWIGSEPVENSSYKIFSVDSCLEANPDDLLRFKKIYNEFIGPRETPKRVFHFPFLSMIAEFRPKLEEIVYSTLNKLDDTEREVVALVAFIHLYAGQPTPAFFIYDAFKLRFKIKGQTSDLVTYNEIWDKFSDDLLNLMVHQSSKKEMYTLQHIEVSKLVFERHLDKKKQRLLSYTEEFLELDLSPVDRFSKLYADLLVFYKAGNSEFKFSSLFTELNKQDERKTAKIFCKAAEVVSDSRVFGNAARFHAKMKKPRFDKARILIKRGIEICEKKRKSPHRIKNTEGIVLFIELKSKRKLIDTIENLQHYAKAAIGAFREARDFPPTFYYPLIGEVEVWLLCIEWIIKECNDDVAEGIHFIHSKAPPFFRTCIGDSFTLLDRADEIIRSSEDIHDVEKAEEHSQRVRLNLVLTTRPKGNSLQTPRRIIDDLSEMFKKMPESSAKQMRRYKAWMMLSLYRDHKLEKPGDLQYLLRVLDDMVFVEKDYTFARHLLRICPQINGVKGYDLARAMEACQHWLTAEKYDPLPYFYSMVIAFIQIINGNGPSGFFALYKENMNKLQEITQSHCRRTEATFFLGKDNNGMCQLVNRATLFENQQYQTDDSDVVKNFWEKESRQKLKECVGRIQVVQQGKRNATKVELLMGGGIKLHVKKNASLGIPGKDFDKEAKVYFVVSFTLSGVVANGITLEPVEAQ